MNLIVDIGNTRIKVAVTHHGEIVAVEYTDDLTPQMVDRLMGDYPIDKAIIASTRSDFPEITRLLRSRIATVLEFLPQTPVPIKNDYLTPQTLGRDRLAAAVGAAALFPGRNVLIIDFGTAVTIDVVSSDATYRGGCISPGLRCRFRALHDYTAKLPLCEATDNRALVGRTTREAIELGVMNSMTFEIEGYITQMKRDFEDLCIIFTGGDAKNFAKRIKNTIFAKYNLVVYGLDRILEFNVCEEHLN